jgi:murein DD-endopeptidase MepM/ murein hydrolase activator NlpD
MQKFSYLLISLLLTGCMHVEEKPQATSTQAAAAATSADDATAALAKQQAADAVVVDKENNAIKINATPPEKKKLKPLFDWPVWEARMSRGFLPQGTKKRRRPHKGIDLAAPRGSAVMASQDGVVIYTGSAFKGYGKMIMIESIDPRDGGNWATLYGHLDKILVYEGKKVKQHEVIGALGNTGRSSGPHLHFEIRRLNGPIDPLPMLPAGEALTNDVDNGAVEE